MKLREVVKFESGKYKISILNDAIVRVEIFRNTEVILEDLDHNFKIYESFLNGRKMPFLIIFGEFSMANRDVQKKFADSKRSQIKLMEAYVIHSLPHRIMGNFHIKFFKPEHPTKIFNKEKDAIAWIVEETGMKVDGLKSTSYL